MSIYSMFALYPRSEYYSGASLEVRSVALLHTFFTLLSSADIYVRLCLARKTACKGTTFF